jgi:hypothetical protein
MSVRRVKAGTTDVSVTIRIVDSTDGTPETAVTSATSGLDLWYRREGAAAVDLTEADLSALTDAHSDGGLLHIADGFYRLDLPDAACASGVSGVQIGGTVTGMVVLAPYIELGATAADVTHWLGTAAATPTTAGVPEVDVTHWNGTAVATPDTAGHPKVTVKSGTGTGELSITSGIASVNASQIGGNTTAATNLSASARGVVTGTVDTAGFTATTTEFETSITEATADHYNGRLIIFYTGALAGQQTLISDYSLESSKGHFTVVALTEAPANGDAFVVV